MNPVGATRAAIRATSFMVWTTGAVAAYHTLRRLDPGVETWPRRRRMVARWAGAIPPIFGLQVWQHGTAPPDTDTTYLVVANHRSPLDILLCIHLIGGVVLAHHGVADMPVIGSAARCNETIFVDQEDRASGAMAVRAMRTCLREGRNVIVFPEGNTFEGDEVRPFHAGAFVAARGLSNVAVLPVGLAYEPGAEFVDETFGTHLFRMSANRRTGVWATIGTPRPVPARGEESMVRDEVQALVDRSATARDGART